MPMFSHSVTENAVNVDAVVMPKPDISLCRQTVLPRDIKSLHPGGSTVSILLLFIKKCFRMIESLIKVLKSNFKKIYILQFWCSFHEQEPAKKRGKMWPELGSLHFTRDMVVNETQRNSCALESTAEMKLGVGKCWPLLRHTSWFLHPPA